MSYILDALKKTEQERDLGQVPGLDAVQEKAHSSPGGRRWVFWLVPVLLINLGVLVWLGTGYQAEEVSASVTVVGDAAPIPDNRVRVPEPALAPAPARVAAPPSAPPVRRPPPRPVSTPVTNPAPPVVASAAPTEPVPVPDAQQVPLWEELDPGVRRAIARPELDVHVYAEQPARRFILVSLRKYREGDRLPDGMQVERILPTGAVFVADGRRFRVERH